jgi:peptide/nickel transport system ATP-binding protein
MSNAAAVSEVSQSHPRRAGLEVRGLSVRFRSARGDVAAVTDLSFDVPGAETLGLVGESGSGKSVTALSLLRLIERPGEIYSGEVVWNGTNLLECGEREIQAIRGKEISIVFQDPLAYLNPVKTIGAHLTEELKIKLGLSKAAALRRGAELLDLVGLQEPKERLDDYPHQLSGGMRQRALIAMAIACEPKLLIADEPTTALDVTVQAGILRLLRKLQRELGMSLILITHDLAVAAGIVDRLAVMYAGRVVETARSEAIFDQPRHPYTLALLESVPRLDEAAPARLVSIPGAPPDPTSLPTGCAFRPRCRFAMAACTSRPELALIGGERRVACWVDVTRDSPTAPAEELAVTTRPVAAVDAAPLLRVDGLSVTYDRGNLLGARRRTRAVENVSFGVARGETVGVVGESGSGKSTLALALLHLLRPVAGSVAFEGHDLARAGRRELRMLRRDMQVILQDPYASLDPRHTIGSILAEPLVIHGVPRVERDAKVVEMLELVGLSRRVVPLYPHQFSGGQRQRIAIARALMLRPRLVVCDEPVSALDVSIRAQVLNLLKDLQQELGLTYLFITHDLGVVRHFCDRVLVMYRGAIVESGPTELILRRPRHPYTRALLAAVPVADPRVQRERLETSGLVPSDRRPEPLGCRFAHRCPFAQERCRTDEPPLEPAPGGVEVACHFWQELPPYDMLTVDS